MIIKGSKGSEHKLARIDIYFTLKYFEIYFDKK